MSGENRESIFLKSVATGDLTTLEWQATHPGIYGEHKLNLPGSGREWEQEIVWVERKEQLWKEFRVLWIQAKLILQNSQGIKKDNL